MQREFDIFLNNTQTCDARCAFREIFLRVTWSVRGCPFYLSPGSLITTSLHRGKRSAERDARCKFALSRALTLSLERERETLLRVFSRRRVEEHWPYRLIREYLCQDERKGGNAYLVESWWQSYIRVCTLMRKFAPRAAHTRVEPRVHAVRIDVIKTT